MHQELKANEADGNSFMQRTAKILRAPLMQHANGNSHHQPHKSFVQSVQKSFSRSSLDFMVEPMQQVAKAAQASARVQKPPTAFVSIGSTPKSAKSKHAQTQQLEDSPNQTIVVTVVQQPQEEPETQQAPYTKYIDSKTAFRQDSAVNETEPTQNNISIVVTTVQQQPKQQRHGKKGQEGVLREGRNVPQPQKLVWRPQDTKTMSTADDSDSETQTSPVTINIQGQEVNQSQSQKSQNAPQVTVTIQGDGTDKDSEGNKVPQTIVVTQSQGNQTEVSESPLVDLAPAANDRNEQQPIQVQVQQQEGESQPVQVNVTVQNSQTPVDAVDVVPPLDYSQMSWWMIFMFYMQGMSYASFVKMLCVFGNVIVQLSPYPEVQVWEKAGDTGNADSAPYIAIAYNGWQWCLYGVLAWLITGRSGFLILLHSNILGAVMGVYYIACFYKKCPHASGISALFRYLFAIVALFLLQVAALLMLDASSALLLIGLISAFCGFIGALSIVVTVPEVIQSKDSSSIPGNIVAANMFGGLVWTACGLMLEDPLIIWPSIANIIACLVCMACKMQYPCPVAKDPDAIAGDSFFSMACTLGYTALNLGRALVSTKTQTSSSPSTVHSAAVATPEPIDDKEADAGKAENGQQPAQLRQTSNSNSVGGGLHLLADDGAEQVQERHRADSTDMPMNANELQGCSGGT